jgi:hypothetical protein
MALRTASSQPPFHSRPGTKSQTKTTATLPPRITCPTYISRITPLMLTTMTTSLAKLLKPFRNGSKSKKKTIKPKRKRPTLEEAECSVCLETEQCLTTGYCNHSICIKCLGGYISVTHNSRMPCPCPSAVYCPYKFTIDDIAPFVNDAQIGKIWLEQATIQIEQGLGMYCPNRDCSKPILWRKKVAKKSNVAGKCRCCSKPVCIPCKSAYHTNLTYDLKFG